ncbi:hypothetical protein D9758_003779 [Tetrapyrgos nigripes]|uniref:Uncharacterized protein n=1 Tax=Tetrapyrgos nigripes TaxID=182062 RepID=A0A8H5LS15_9AGAR|nr:hypothetical protein D9758_003779 [Tetrapyrgos nigripes]
MSEQSLLDASLSESFSPPSLRRQSIPPAKPQSEGTEETPANPPDTLSASSDAHEKWKEEYEDQVKVWKSQSAEAREKAEKERARWESIRRSASLEGVHINPPPSSSASWDSISTTDPVLEGSPSPADARDLVTGETPKTQVVEHTTHSRQETGDDQKWEDLPSEVTSSLPSMSFPESNEDSSPDHRDHDHRRQPPLEQPTSVTLSVFDSSLSTKTRLKALCSALAINLLLPFVNGVMLGFGEIFAKDIVLGWLGRKPERPGSVSSSLGLRKSLSRRSRSDS